MNYLHWNLALLTDQLGALLADAEAVLAEEQAVKGLDTFAELEIQSILAKGLGQHYRVEREVHYPSSAGPGSKLSHRARCDLVLTAREQAPPAKTLWLEIKVATQLAEGGERHRGYTQRWHGVIRDLRKMNAEPDIEESALVLVVFTESENILNKDLDTFETLMVRQGVLAGFRHVRTRAIADRNGHRLCSVAVWPTGLR
jgi:hypothetical protein